MADSTWEPEKHLEYVQDLIEEYEQANSPKAPHNIELSSINSCLAIDDYSIGGSKKDKSIREGRQKLETKAKSKDGTRFDEDTVEPVKVSQPQPGWPSESVKEGDIKSREGKKSEEPTEAKKAGGTETAATQMSEGEKGEGGKGKGIRILGMKKEGSEYWYYVVERNGSELWVVRDFVVQQHPISLIEFYEQRIVFGP